MKNRSRKSLFSLDTLLSLRKKIVSTSNLDSDGATNTSSRVRHMFRKQAVEFHRTKQYGTVLLLHPFSHRALTAVFVTIAFGLLAFFFLFSTTRKAQSQGVLLPEVGVISVRSNQQGIVAEQRVREGQAVKQGDVLFVLFAERSTGLSTSTERVVSTLMQSRRDSFADELKHSALQSRQRIEVTTQRGADLQLEAARLADQIALQQQRVALADQAFNRFRELQATNFISPAQLQDKQGELLDQRQRLADLQRQQLGKQREHAAARADLLDLQAQAQRDAQALQRNVSTLDQDLIENEARRKVVVLAPSDGVVTAITSNIGQSVAGNTTLASLIPAGAELEAEIYAPSRSIGFVKPGMTVLLRYQAYPYQKFGQHTATVRDVTHTSVPAAELLAGTTSLSAGRAEPMYRIRLKLDQQTVMAYGKPMPLKSGMLLDASILLEKRRLYEWVLEPLFSIAGRI